MKPFFFFFRMRKLTSFFTIFTCTALILLFQNCGSNFKPDTDNSSENLSSVEPENPLPAPTTPGPQCALNMHLESAVCVSNKRPCPVTNGIAEETWNGSNYGACTVVTCNAGYSNQSNVCVFSPLSCPIVNGNGQTQPNGTCRLVSCSPGYHVNGNSCDINERPCPVLNGTGREIWNGTTYSACQIATCNPNYHVENNACLSNTRLCPIANGVGQSTWNGTAYSACALLTCNPGYDRMGNTCVASGGGGSSTWMPRNSSRFFISGHSLTDDPLSSYIVDIATKRGDSVAYNQQIIIGSLIRSRTRDSSTTAWPGYSLGKNRDGSFGLNVISEFRNPQTIGAGQRYDTLIITENHHIPVALQWENTIGYLRHYHDRLIDGNPSARTLFYNSWLDIDKNNPAIWIDYEKKALVAWECTTSKVNHTLQAAGRNDRTLNLPVGAALVDLVEKAIANQVTGISGTTLQKMNMIFSDNVHLTPLGTYYAALVTYSSIYGKTGSGVTPPSGVNATTASALQSLAWTFVNDYYNRNNPGLRDMAECRSYISQQVCPALWTLKQETFRIPACQSYFNNTASSPFIWPDPNFTALPAP